MKLIHDLRIQDDRLALGRTLRVIIASWGGADGNVPMGAAFDSLEEIRRHLEQSFIDQVGEVGESGTVARLLGRLLGRAPRRGHAATPEDWARFQGQREALAEFIIAIRRLAAEAYVHDTQAEELARAEKEHAQRRPSVAPRPLGKSAL